MIRDPVCRYAVAMLEEDQSIRIAVILPAAGQSRRFAAGPGSSEKSKLDVTLGHKPVVLRAIELFLRRKEVCQIILAVDPDGVDAVKFKYGDKLALMNVTIVPGGKTERWETVKNALAVVSEEATHVAVHDAARPVTSQEVIDRVFEAAAQFEAVIPASPVSATVRRIDPAPAVEAVEVDPLDAILGSAGKPVLDVHRAVELISRENLVLIETPQVFEKSLLQRAYARIDAGEVETAEITDDGGLVEAMGESVFIVPGDPLNIKITRPEDIAFAEAILRTSDPEAMIDPLSTKRKHKTWAEMDDD